MNTLRLVALVVGFATFACNPSASTSLGRASNGECRGRTVARYCDGAVEECVRAKGDACSVCDPSWGSLYGDCLRACRDANSSNRTLCEGRRAGCVASNGGDGAACWDECRADASGGAGSCLSGTSCVDGGGKLVCKAVATCREAEQCGGLGSVCVNTSNDAPGYCTSDCDPINNVGCAVGEACTFRVITRSSGYLQERFTVPSCEAEQRGPRLGEACDDELPCAGTAYCAVEGDGRRYCARVCARGAEDVCAAGTKCLAAYGPARQGGPALGLCWRD